MLLFQNLIIFFTVFKLYLFCVLREQVFEDDFEKKDSSKWSCTSGSSCGSYVEIDNSTCGSESGNSMTFSTYQTSANVRTEKVVCSDCDFPTEYQLKFWFVTGRGVSDPSYPECKAGSSDVEVRIVPVDGSIGEMSEYALATFPYDYNDNIPTVVEITFWTTRPFKIEFYTSTGYSSFQFAVDSLTITSGPKEDCSGHGSCKTSTSDCQCDVGYTGTVCEYEMCVDDESENRQKCSNNGFCVKYEGCICDDGWVGANCSYPSCFTREVFFEDKFEFRDTSKWTYKNSYKNAWPGYTCGSDEGFASTFSTRYDYTTITMNEMVFCKDCALPTEYLLRFWFVTGRASRDVGYPDCKAAKRGNYVTVYLQTFDGKGNGYPKYKIKELGYDYNDNKPSFVEVYFTVNRLFELQFYDYDNSGFNYAIDSLTVRSGPSVDCGGHGHCNSEQVCQCYPKFTGETCQYEMCVEDEDENQEICFNHGFCVNEVGCMCEDNWAGTNCSHPTCEHRELILEDDFEFRDVELWYAKNSWGNVEPSIRCGSDTGFAFTMTTKYDYSTITTVDKISCPSCSNPTEYTVRFWFVTGRSAFDVNYPNCKQGGKGTSVEVQVVPVDGSIGPMKTYTVLTLPYDYNGNKPSYVEFSFWMNRPFYLQFYEYDNSGYNYALDNLTVFTGPNCECHGHGFCDSSSNEQCVCSSGYFGDGCEYEMCDSDETKNRELCSNHGDCEKSEGCVCDKNWLGDECSHPSCESREVVFEDYFEYVDISKWSAGSWNNIYPSVDCGSESGLAFYFSTKYDRSTLTTSTIPCCGSSKTEDFVLSFWFVTGRVARDADFPNCKQGASSTNPLQVNLLLDNGKTTQTLKSLPYNFNDNLPTTVVIPFSSSQPFSIQLYIYDNSGFNYAIDNFVIRKGPLVECHGRGWCEEYGGRCTCEDPYLGESCTLVKCYEEDEKNREYCNEHGTCGNFTCFCDEGYTGSRCDDWTCYDHTHESTSVCGGHGVCVSADNCSCSNLYLGEECNDYKCYGLLETDEDVCSGRGICESPDKCVCNEYQGIDPECNLYPCYSEYPTKVWSNNSAEVCFGHGTCTDTLKCTCDSSSYSGVDCSVFSCYEIERGSPGVCSAHGTCVDVDECQCDNDEYYKGKECQYFECFDIPNNESSVVCSGRGECMDHDFCSCEAGFQLEQDCSEFGCFNVRMDSSDVCSGYGECVGPDDCNCLEGYEGSDCSSFSCFGISKDDVDEVCSGNGECIKHDTCKCTGKYSGKKCSSLEAGYVVLAVVLSILGSICLCVISCVLLVCCCGLLVVIIFFSGSSGAIGIFGILGRKTSTLSEYIGINDDGEGEGISAYIPEVSGGRTGIDRDDDIFIGQSGKDVFQIILEGTGSTFLFRLKLGGDDFRMVPLPKFRICPFCHSLNLRDDDKCKHTTCSKCHMHYCHICLSTPNYDDLLFGNNAPFSDPEAIQNHTPSDRSYIVVYGCQGFYAPCGRGGELGLYGNQTRRNQREWSKRNEFNDWRRRNGLLV